MGEEPQNSNPQKRKWKRKSKNFLTNAKKYGKKGQLGRGAPISEELYQYFVGILDALKKGVGDGDERKALVNNVLERTKGDEMNIISNQLGSRVIEILLPYSTPEDLERFIEIVTSDLRKLCSDNFTSHVIETLLRVSCSRATEHLQSTESNEEVPAKKTKLSISTYPQEHLDKCYEFTLKVCKYALNNLEDFVWDSYANHILRSALRCLSGITMLPGEKVNKLLVFDNSNESGIPPHATKITYKVVPDEYKELVRVFAHRLSSWPQFSDLPYQNLTSGLLQVLLYAVKAVDKQITRNLIVKLLDESFAPEDWVSNVDEEDKKDEKEVEIGEKEDKIGEKEDNRGEKEDKKGGIDDKKAGKEIEMGEEDKKLKDSSDKTLEAEQESPTKGLPPVFQSQSAVRLLEAALFVAKKKTYTLLYARCFINRLARLAVLPSLNFTVQRLIDNVMVKEEFEPMYSELNSQFSSILSSGNSGVLVAIAKACLRLNAKQAHFITAVETALGCDKPDTGRYLAVCVLRLTPLSKIDTGLLDRPYFIHVHGSVIVQTLLQYQRPGKLVQSILELSSEELLVVLCDAKGCHIADVMCTAVGVGGKARDKLIWRIKGYWQKLALSQYGSRAFEQVFNAASLEQKVKIMQEMTDKSNLLNSTMYGRKIAEIVDVAGFKSSQKTWEQKWAKKSDKNNKK